MGHNAYWVVGRGGGKHLTSQVERGGKGSYELEYKVMIDRSVLTVIYYYASMLVYDSFTGGRMSHTTYLH